MNTNINKTYFFIREYIENNSYSPTFREIGEYLGGLSTSTVNNYIQELCEKGLIKIDRNKKSRTIVLTKKVYKKTKENIDVYNMLVNDRSKLTRKLRRSTGIEYYQIESIIDYIDKLLLRI